MAEILDNEVITAEILNDISIDLGYSELKFLENEKFGNDKLNAITGDLVSSGLLNILNKCECTLLDTQISVNSGVVVFADGAKKRITEINVLDILEGGKNYIYAKNDTSIGKIYLENSLTEPTGDFVLLAEYENGVLTDKRVMAKAKVILPTEGNSYKKIVYTPFMPEGVATEYFSLPTEGIEKIFILKESQEDGYVFLYYDCQTHTFTGIHVAGWADLKDNQVTNANVVRLKSGTTAVSLGFYGEENGITTFYVSGVEEYLLYSIGLVIYAFGGI